ncbi:hypothetical protein AMECASPLE_031030 [Ameca splendens]|uniref:Uncharacterized protein n=1 Tax=Ameca splendens TaxID=208324 RepID=A0ABV0YTN5_9TELE
MCASLQPLGEQLVLLISSNKVSCCKFFPDRCGGSSLFALIRLYWISRRNKRVGYDRKTASWLYMRHHGATGEAKCIPLYKTMHLSCILMARFLLVFVFHDGKLIKGLQTGCKKSSKPSGVSHFAASLLILLGCDLSLRLCHVLVLNADIILSVEL